HDMCKKPAGETVADLPMPEPAPAPAAGS
ncbi:MAG: hypothetical protein JWR88_2413, partial [Pseudonocardia sp.]|nr:hypothetical protein [Pseudonocardia sp.]